MNVNGIGTAGHPVWQENERTQQNTAGKSFAAQVNQVADMCSGLPNMKWTVRDHPVIKQN